MTSTVRHAVPPICSAGAGLRRGDRVAAVLSRQIETWIVALAAWRSGLVYVPLFCGFGTDALAYRLTSSGAKLIVVGHHWRAVVEAAMGGANLTADVVTVAPRGSHDDTASGDRSFWKEVDRSTRDGIEVDTSATDLATLLFTSGTTGEPKSCMITHSGLLAVLPFAKHSLGVDERSLLFTAADPGWAYGLYTTGAAPMAMGVPRIMYSGDFSASKWWGVIAAERVSALAAAPSAYPNCSPHSAQKVRLTISFLPQRQENRSMPLPLHDGAAVEDRRSVMVMGSVRLAWFSPILRTVTMRSRVPSMCGPRIRRRCRYRPGDGDRSGCRRPHRHSPAPISVELRI